MVPVEFQPTPNPEASIAATRRPSAEGLQARSAACPETGQLGLGQLQPVGLILAPPAQEHRLTLPVLDLHPEQLDEELAGSHRGTA